MINCDILLSDWVFSICFIVTILLFTLYCFLFHHVSDVCTMNLPTYAIAVMSLSLSNPMQLLYLAVIQSFWRENEYEFNETSDLKLSKIKWWNFAVWRKTLFEVVGVHPQAWCKQFFWWQAVHYKACLSLWEGEKQ